jgi:hypothetical protein
VRVLELADATKSPGRYPGWRDFGECSFLKDSRYTSQQENAAPTVVGWRRMSAPMRRPSAGTR